MSGPGDTPPAGPDVVPPRPGTAPVPRGAGVRSIAITDLSENAELVKAKQDSEERLRVISHALPIPIAYIDQSGTYQFNNDAHERWFKVSRDEIVGFGEVHLLHPDLSPVELTGEPMVIAGCEIVWRRLGVDPMP